MNLLMGIDDGLGADIDDGNAVCDKFREGEGGNSNKENLIRGFSVAIVILSILSLLTIILTINSEEKIRAHPAKLIRLICLIEAIFGW
jgi:hypothetical protein